MQDIHVTGIDKYHIKMARNHVKKNKTKLKKKKEKKNEVNMHGPNLLFGLTFEPSNTRPK